MATLKNSPKINFITLLVLASVTLFMFNPCASAHTNVTAEQARELIDSTNNLTIVDVREQYEYCDVQGHIQGALNYPWNSGVLRARYEELPMNDPVMVVCRSGGRSNNAANFLDSQGFSMVYDMLGGMSAWIWETVPCKYDGGSGTATDPYQIATAEDLMLLGESPDDYDKHFILTADIDLDPNLSGRKIFDRAIIAPDINDTERWFQGAEFMGVFDGNGHTISHLTIDGSKLLGLFGWLESGAEVKNMGVVNVKITGSESYIGGLVGYNDNGNISNCYSSGTVTGGDWNIGGLVGFNYKGSITMCHSIGTVTGENSDIGGLVGANYGGSISKSYSTGNIAGKAFIGGLVGFNSGNVTTCYSTGSASGEEYIGGFVGYNNGGITMCYSTGIITGERHIGGFAGYDEWHYYYYSGFITSSFWDMEASGQTCSNGGVGLTTVEMMDPEMLGLNGFANDPNWVLNPGLDYPRLAWEGTPGDIIPESNIDWMTGLGTPDNPYRIDAADQLILLGKASILWDKSFVLGVNINLDPNLPDGQIFGQAIIPKFAGVFDGNDHIISNLTISGGSLLGLFGRLENGAEVKNLGIENVNILGTDYLGSLAATNDGNIIMCHSTSEVTGNENIDDLTGQYSDVPESEKIGGLVGWNRGNITMCYSTGMVTGSWDVGGLVGSNESEEITEGITASYSTATVSGDTFVGGLVGYNGHGDNLGGFIITCYSTGTVTGNQCVGGIVGGNTGIGIFSITNSYSTGMVTGNEGVGGLVGYHMGPDNVTSSFWDVETSGQTVSDGGIGKTTTEMQTADTFLNFGWDFVDETANGTEDIWWIDEGVDYPHLWWEASD